MKKVLVSAALLLLMFVAPVARSADQLALEYNAADIDNPVTPSTSTCPVVITSFRDMRPNKESIGTAFKPIATGDALPWIDGALSNLKAWGFETNKKSLTPGQVGVSADLTRSYVWHAGLRLNGMVAMTVTYTLPSGSQLTRKYRASSSKTNWANGLAEFGTTLNMAMNNLLDRMATDLSSICRNETPNQTTANR